MRSPRVAIGATMPTTALVVILQPERIVANSGEFFYSKRL